jgi:glutathionyl-hydroquinone reductase
MPNLPAKSIIQLGRFTWTTIWQVMMGQLAPRSKTGEYRRPESAFRHSIQPDSPHPPMADRYRLFVGMSCPWAHRTLIVRALKGLESTIGVALTLPSPEDGGWRLAVPEQGCQQLPALYRLAQPNYQGRSTVPMLWDQQTKTIVNNESAEIIQILNAEFNDFAIHADRDLYPAVGRDAIDEWNEKIYHSINNGVYRCGFAQSQAAYDTAVDELFTMLDTIETHLSRASFLWGDTITLADVRLFTTLIRFDAVYYSLFKCSRRRIRDYVYLSRYVRQIYHLPGVAATCDFEAIQRDYYSSLFPLNPGGIVPTAIDMSWLDAVG